MKVMIAEDEDLIREGLIEILQSEGYKTIEAKDGVQAIEMYTQEQPDFICLDIMMPGMSGYDVCKSIRKHDPDVPIIFISAKSEEIDKVIGLELGADDFIVKPFGVKEVIARIRAVTRRCLEKQDLSKKHFQFGDLSISKVELVANRGNDKIELSYRDVMILELFVKHKGEVLDRDTIFNACWGSQYFPNSRTLDQHISKLRKRIEADPKQPKLIMTVHGRGYRYDE